LLGWVADAPGAQRWLDYLRALGQGASGGFVMQAPAAASPAAAPAVGGASARPRVPRSVDADTPPPVAKRPARFCSACGTPVLAGARFCQQCGNVLGQD